MQSLGFALTIGHVGGGIWAVNLLFICGRVYFIYSTIYFTIGEAGREGTSDDMFYL